MLTRLPRDDVASIWSDKQQAAFDELRRRLQTPAVLAHFDEDAATTVHTDASNVGLGAVLVQWQDGAERVIANTRRKLSREESKY